MVTINLAHHISRNSAGRLFHKNQRETKEKKRQFYSFTRTKERSGKKKKKKTTLLSHKNQRETRKKEKRRQLHSLSRTKERPDKKTTPTLSLDKKDVTLPVKWASQLESILGLASPPPRGKQDLEEEDY